METKALTQILLASIETEVQQWAEESGTISNGYDYESKFIDRVRAIKRILLEKSVEMKGKARDKKNSTRVLEYTKVTKLSEINKAF